MKSLDEVIQAYEICMNPGGEAKECFGCPYADETGEPLCCGEDKEDALHYLKEYRSEKAMWEADRNGYLNWIEQYKEAREKHQQAVIELKKNPPLTMKEFSRMIDTEPIWCQELQEWYLFLAYDDGDNRIQLMTDKGDIETFDEDDLEKYPLYRRK